MNQLAARLIEARRNNDIINYYVEYQCIKIVHHARRTRDDRDTVERINGVDVDTMRQAVRQSGQDVAAHVLTIWS